MLRKLYSLQSLLGLNTLLIVLGCVFSQQTCAELSIKGLDDEAETNVRTTLALSKEACKTPEWKIRGLFDKADADIDQALRALGYYHAIVEKTLTIKSGCWLAEFRIQPGERTIIQNIQITLIGAASTDKNFNELRETLVAQKTQPLRHDFYESIKSKFNTLAQDQGYLSAQFIEKKLLIDKENNGAEIILTFDSGPRMRFGKLTVEQDILRPGLVARFLDMKTGDYYSSEHIANTYNALSNSGYFDSIAIRPDLEHIVQQHVPVTVQLKPKSKHHYGFGAGFDTDIGPLGSAAYSNRRINRLGHLLNANMDLSPVLSTTDAEYVVPLKNPVFDAFSFGAGGKMEDTNTYRSATGKISARLKHLFRSGWKQTLFLDYSYENFDTGTTTGNTLVLAPGVSWLRSVSDNLLRPNRGYRVQMDLTGSYKALLSDVSFAQALLSAIYITPAPWSSGADNSTKQRSKWIARTELGATWVDPFSRLPTTNRFYAGGISSVRGYAYKELGPKDSSGTVVGGTFLAVFSFEYEQAILDDWAVAAFIDTGNAFKYNTIELKTGVGIGARWYSPIGPVRIDVGLPMNESDSTFQIHFAAGARL